MNKHLMEYDLGNGETIFVEVDTTQGGIKRVNKDTNIEKARINFEQAVKGIKPAAQKVMEALSGLSPDEIELEVGLKFSAEAGVVLASAGSEATFTVKLTWKPQQTKQDGQQSK